MHEAERAARRLARSHYENFIVASVLLPGRLRQPFYNVYAFCRIADDLADESASPGEALAYLSELQSQLDQTFRGQPPPNLFLALARTIEQFHLPQQPFNDLLDAFRQDQRQHRYATIDELLDYCRRSANPVGQIVLRLGGCLDDERAALSDQICTGLQLVNFWQDVARDFARGRIYLPGEAMSRFEVSETMLASAPAAPQLRRLLASECDRAAGFLERGLSLVPRVPRWLAGDVQLFAAGGLATIEAIRRVEFDVLRARPTVGRWQQTTLVIRALLKRPALAAPRAASH